MKPLHNSKGMVLYGMHFYPGVAQYQDAPDQAPYRIFLNEATLRKMDPTFAAKPVYVEHVDIVPTMLDDVKNEADGWVIESFFNQADGKHWVKFIVTSAAGLDAIKKGFRLSNAYKPTEIGPGGEWNGVEYQNEVTNGYFGHLALVDNPRYEESVIKTPEQFKEYCESMRNELREIANEKNHEENKMSFKLWKKEVVKNSAELESTVVTLPKCKKDMTISEIINAYDEIQNMNGYANEDHMVKVGEDEMSVKDLVKKQMKMNTEMEEMKKNAEEKDGDSKDAKANDADDTSEDMMDNESEDKEEKDAKDKKDNAEDEEDEKDKKEKKNAKAIKDAEVADRAARLRKANLKNVADDSGPQIDLSYSQVARGNQLFGS